MNDLVNFAVEAHGGLKRWSRVTAVTVAASITGETWKLKGKPDYLKNVIFAVDTKRERVTMVFLGEDKRSVFEPNRIEMQRRDGTVVATRNDPEASFQKKDQLTPWDDLDVAYFSGEALYAYINTPFLYEGFSSEEIAPIDVDGETWRRLKVTFPTNLIATAMSIGGRTMARERFLRVRFLLIALLALVATGGAAAHSSTTTNIILVHGAWADGSSWSRVIPLLEARGLHVTAVQLPLTSLADDVETTKRAIALMEREHPGPIVLVGHSYAGVVIGEAGNDPNVVRLVYVASVAPDQGQSLLSLLNGWQTPSPVANHLVFNDYMTPTPFVTIDPVGVEQDFAQCLPEVERRVVTATQGPTNLVALGGVATSPAWKTKPSWFIVAKRDRTIPADLEATTAATIGARTTTLNTCHLAMLDMPFQVARVIADATRGE